MRKNRPGELVLSCASLDSATLHVSVICIPWSCSGSGEVPARSKERRRYWPSAEAPYLDSLMMATPYPNSLTSQYYGLFSLREESLYNAYLVAANLELCCIPSSILVRWAGMISELGVINGLWCPDIKRHFELENTMSFMPVNLCIESDQGSGVYLTGCYGNV
jgi:hypothetical protein